MLFACVCLFLTLVIVKISHWFYTWANPKCNGKLPPGSMGFPLIGETLEFFSPYPLHDIPPFVKKRMQRYGPMFRTNIVGQNVIVSTDYEINNSIFQEENKSFILWYTESFFKILGKNSIHYGTIHKYIWNLVFKLTGSENLKEIIHEMDEVTRRHLNIWAKHGTVEVKEASNEALFEYLAKKLISYEESSTVPGERLRDKFKLSVEGLISVPLNIPGTAFHACLQGRKYAIKVIKDTIIKRKTTKVEKKDYDYDLLDQLLEEAEKKDTILEEKIIVDMIFGLLFTTHETTSAALTLAIKFLADHPQALAQLTKEHELILERRETKESSITWTEYKSMTFTHMVINETARLANIVPGIFRKAQTDVEINGYIIPKGWLVMVVPSVVHLSDDKYENPFQFNPWRWEGQKLHSGSKTWMAFGRGARLCAGADFAKVQMSIFLHYLVTKYRWSVIKGGDVVRKPGLTFPNGLHIQISKISN